MYALTGPYILWTGTLEPRKNLGGLLAAFDALETEIELVLVGPPGWSQDVDQLLARLPDAKRSRVRRLGWVPRSDLGPLYAGADVFCFPSLLEGFGFPVVEAMAQGTPVVTSTGTSTEELVADGAGLAVDPRDTGAIAAALESVLSDPALAEGLAAAGPVRARTYTWTHTAELTVRAYEEAAAR
jgi:glycosyltransferase involved in cell wall biosynthesis